MKIAICFYGLTRSLKYTLNSIKKNIFEVLSARGIDYDVYVHTYSLSVLTNSRSNEREVPLNPEEYLELSPVDARIEAQEIVDTQMRHEMYTRCGDPWNDNFQSMKNIVRAYNSMSQVVDMVPSGKYTRIMCIRPDCVYRMPFNVGWLNTNAVIVPDFHHWGGVNDRFLCGPEKPMRTLMKRYNYWKEMHETGQFKTCPNGEYFLKYILRRKGITYVLVKFIFSRMRADGRICPLDA